MNRSSLLTLVLLALAIAVPCAALLVVPGADYPVIAPFVWKHVVLIHISAVAWFCWLMAKAILTCISGRLQQVLPAVGVAAGVALAIGSVWIAPWVSDRLDAIQAGFGMAAAVRLTWAMLLVFPWMLAAAAATTRRAVLLVSPHLALILVSMVIAIVLPIAYQRDLFAKRTRVLEELIQQAHWRDAALLSNALTAMRGDEPVRGVDPSDVNDMLNQRVQDLIAEISKPVPANETRQQRITRAVSLAGLGEYEIAASLVGEDASDNLASAMLLAAILQDQKQFEQSNRWYRHALRLAAGIEDADARRENRRMCYDALAYNARELKHYRDAEAVYREAQRVEPTDIPYFNLQLGKHYRLGGRPAMAMQHLELAAEQDGKLAQEADGQLRLLRHDTPGCFLGRPLSQPARR